MRQLRFSTALPLALLLALPACGDDTSSLSDAGIDADDAADDTRQTDDLTFIEDTTADAADEEIGPDAAAPGETGAPCDTDSDCTGAFCLAVLGGDDRLCTNLCADDDDCALEAWSCLLVTNTGDDAVRVCVPDAVCFDDDNDGFGRGPACAGPDCNDDDDTVFLGADEVCNGADDDCDGIVDEFFVGFNEACDTGFEGACQGGRQACVEGSPVCLPTIEPTDEVCNGIDDDCDGAIDLVDGAPIATGCYSGPAATEGVGICTGGSRVCTDGVLSACAGEVLPSPVELCNGLDDDCDGAVDEDDPFGGVRCETGSPGVCALGTTLCSEGSTICVADINPDERAEVCNGLDDDCDGTVDLAAGGAAILTTCYTGPAGTLEVGVCQGGVRTCEAGVLGACVGEVRPAPFELCDGLDNDCDGAIDEDDPFGGFRCETGNAGICRLGTTVCSDGENVCVADVEPGVELEVCNGLDDDCNGIIDDLDVALCPLQQGVCAGSVGACRPSGGTLACTFVDYGDDYEFIEVSCDGLDNDCNGIVDDVDLDRDGFIDEACGGNDCDDRVAFINPGAEELCGNDVDEDCSGLLGDRDADGDGAFDDDPRCETPGTDCNDDNENIGPSATEIRDALDNDCDGDWDEGLISSGDLIITEVMKDPDSVSDIRGEWFEVYNATDIPMALNSFRFADTGIDFFDVSPLEIVIIPPRSYAVLCDFADPAVNGGVTCDLEYDNFLLGNNSDSIIARHVGVEIDRVAYDNSWPGNSGGRSMAFKQSLLGGATPDVTENNLVGNWCSTPNNAANRMPGGDYGSPGRVNTCP